MYLSSVKNKTETKTTRIKREGKLASRQLPRPASSNFPMESYHVCVKVMECFSLGWSIIRAGVSQAWTLAGRHLRAGRISGVGVDTAQTLHSETACRGGIIDQ